MKYMLQFIFLSCLTAISSTAYSAPFGAAPPFIHGVASGDALSDRVIIWTRITDSSSVSFNINWKVATDTLFNNVVQSGNFTTDTSMDYTVKVDVAGLVSDTWYYYQFEYNGNKSLIGRTKTLPVGDNERVRLAVASCARYGGGDFYNPYAEIAKRNDLQAVVFLGDYIYEGSGGISGRGIQVLPTHEIITLEDYRQRYSTYRLDPDLRTAHQQYPFYNVWDDHETANDSWMNGAEEHDSTTEGSWAARKAAGQRAFFEWLPIRPKAQNDYSIYRSFSFGNLANLVMIDSRLEARDVQASLGNQTAYADTNRTMLGAAQMQWLKDELSDSLTQWKIIGNQVMFAPLKLGSVYFSNDQWDGYQGDRNRIISHVMNNNIENVAVITGDIHTSWGNDVPIEGASYNPTTGAGSAFVEFITPSISTGSPVSNTLLPLIELTNPHLKYVDLVHYGYLVLDMDTTRIQSDWYHVSTLQSTNYTATRAASWYVNNHERFLHEASGAASPYTNPAPFAPVPVDTVNGVVTATSLLSGFTVYPNPFTNELAVNYTALQKGNIRISVNELSGKEVLREESGEVIPGTYTSNFNTSQLAKGIYLVKIYSDTRLGGITKMVKN